MLKKFSKLLLSYLAIFMISSSLLFCFATEAVTTAETTETANNAIVTETEESVNADEDKNCYSDLYLREKNVNIDYIVYGNVYIIADTVTITGQIEGNLFVYANKLSLDKSYVGGCVYAYADDIYYNAASSYLYAKADSIEMTYESYVVRDAKIKADKSIIKAAIGRDLHLESYKIDLGEDDKLPIIYNNFEYSAPSEISIPNEVLTENSTVSYSYKMPVYLKIIIFLLVTVIIAYIILVIIIKLKKNTTENLEKKDQDKEAKKAEKLKSKAEKKAAKLEARAAKLEARKAKKEAKENSNTDL